VKTGMNKRIDWLCIVAALSIMTSSVVCAAQTEALEAVADSSLENKLLETVDVNFDNAPIVDALRILAEKGNINIVANGDMSGTVSMRVSEMPLGDVLRSVLDVSGYTYEIDESLLKVRPANRAAPHVRTTTKTFPVNYADVEEVEKSVELALSSAGRVHGNKMSGTLVVSDVEENFAAIEKVIRDVDHETPQVLIEARIVDVTLDETNLLGVNWQLFDNDDLDPAGIPRKLISSETFEVGKLSTTLRVGTLGQDMDVTSVIQALRKNGNARLLAHPTILSLNNEQATIEIIEEIPYQELTETQEGGAIGTTDFKEVGVKLSVTPRVSDKDHVILKINPSFSLLTGFTEGTDQPIVDVREANTTMMVGSGSTVVIGGLRRSSDAVTVHKVPVLGDIPGVGFLFRSRKTDKVNTELLVFVSPTIIRSPGLSNRQAAIYKEQPRQLLP